MGFPGGLISILELPPDAIPRAIRRIREVERVTWREVSADLPKGRSGSYGNFLALDLIESGGAAHALTAIHPDLVRVAVALDDREGLSSEPYASDREIVLRPGETLLLPYSGFSYRHLHPLDIPVPVGGTPAARLWSGWSLTGVSFPRGPLAQRPIALSPNHDSMSDTIHGSATGTAADIPAQPVTYAVLQNTDASESLYYALGKGAAATTDATVLTPGASIVLPVGDLEEISVLSSGAATAYAVSWVRKE